MLVGVPGVPGPGQNRKVLSVAASLTAERKLKKYKRFRFASNFVSKTWARG